MSTACRPHGPTGREPLSPVARHFGRGAQLLDIRRRALAPL